MLKIGFDVLKHVKNVVGNHFTVVSYLFSLHDYMNAFPPC